MKDGEPCFAADNLLFLEEALARYHEDPASVDPGMRRYFESLEAPCAPRNPCAQPRQPPRQSQSSRQFPPRRTSRPPGEMPVGQRPGAVQVRAPPVHTGRIGGETDTAGMLARCPLFAALPDEALRQVATVASPAVVDAGEAVCREGETGDALFIIVEGTVVVSSAGRVLAERGAGDVVGELAVLDSQPRSADVIARTRVRLLVIHATDFQDLLERHPPIAGPLLRVLASRVRGHDERQERVDRLVRAYRERGHTIADLDPLGLISRTDPTLALDYHGLSERDLDSVFSVRLGESRSIRTLARILASLRNTYCAEIGVQYTHINDLEIQEWLRVRMEATENHRALTHDEQIRILAKLTDAEVFESFLQRKFTGAKRFSLQGAESLIPLLDQAIEAAASHGVEEVIIGMAHRGRLNVLANILDKPASRIFREFEDRDAEAQIGRGDVKYHLGHSLDRVSATGRTVHLSLCFNPSHLECIDPVVIGRTRAKQDRIDDGERRRAMAVLIHGNAAFAGQGIMQEVLNMSELAGYRIGGTVHIIVNNQIAFTSEPDQGRSCQYVSDVARMLQIPIFHVNGEHPEAVHQVVHLAMEFRSRFQKDVVIDMYCYRRYGHNEGDDPSYTQPGLYRAIGKRVPLRTAYTENLLKLGGLAREEAETIATRSRARLESHLREARRKDYPAEEARARRGVWARYGASGPEVSTAVPAARLRELLIGASRVPEDFRPHRRLARLLEARRAMARGEQPLDWGAGEALAFATLLDEDFRVRVSGQDVERGTFAHRHAVWHDVNDDGRYVPLAHLSDTQAPFEIHNSPLSETGVLGFEYGYSLDCPDALVVWEAQFGDFANVAQVIIDQFIISAEDKWERLSGLCLFLPHGFDGQGAEHSSARLERFLSLAAEDNMRIVNLTTPAQLFHALRRQVLAPVRKPLVVMSPKVLLRHRGAVSKLEELSGGRFQHALPDAAIRQPARVRRIVLCTGKLYYELAAERAARGIDDIALVRIEQLYPFPVQALLALLATYPPEAGLAWAQEEPVNMGAWPFLRARVAERLARAGRALEVCHARDESASPATGSHAAHAIEQEALIDAVLA